MGFDRGRAGGEIGCGGEGWKIIGIGYIRLSHVMGYQ